MSGRKTYGHSSTRNFSAVVDANGIDQLEAGIRWNQLIQVNHGAAFPQKSAPGVEIARHRYTPNLASGTDGPGLAKTVFSQRAKIGDDAVTPQRRIKRTICKGPGTGYLRPVIDDIRRKESSPDWVYISISISPSQRNGSDA